MPDSLRGVHLLGKSGDAGAGSGVAPGRLSSIQRDSVSPLSVVHVQAEGVNGLLQIPLNEAFFFSSLELG